MIHVTRKIYFDSQFKVEKPDSIDKEWILTNGLGGYSSMSITGNPLRKYHGLLVAALPAPLGRIVMLHYVEDYLKVGDLEALLSPLDLYDEKNDFISPLIEFRLEDGLPVWTYQLGDITLEKRIILSHLQNTLHISYMIIEGNQEAELVFRPYFQFRHHEASPSQTLTNSVLINKIPDNHHYELKVKTLPTLSLMTKGTYVPDPRSYEKVRYRFEEERGYDSVGKIISPGYFKEQLKPKERVYYIVSTENYHISFSKALQAEKERRDILLGHAKKVHPDIERSPFALELLYAADQFVIIPATRPLDVTFNKSLGIDPRTVIAGYHWFTDWGRDLMISLEGLLLATGRFEEAKACLITYSHYIKDGLIPNMFPDSANVGRYNTADATLWFFHALDKYLTYSKDAEFLKEILPKMIGIIQEHLRGTKYNIHVDPNDGLLYQGEEGVALTWMDAVYKDYIVTPRRGKAVEINALWYNALNLAIEWMKEFEADEETLTLFQNTSILCKQSFNQKFWNPKTHYLYDVIEGPNGNDSACRPNQLFSISLKYPVLKNEYWKPVLAAVSEKLLTPFGLRTLSSDHPDYKVVYKGDLFLRDSAYHQGTVWPWLIGPFVDVWLKVYPDRKKDIFLLLKNFEHFMNESGIGTINEIYDAETPYIHRGCISQAWSIAEIYRSWMKLYQEVLAEIDDPRCYLFKKP